MSGYYIKLGDPLRVCFGTSDPTTKEATDADSLPAVVVLEQGSPIVYSPTVTNIDDGIYEAEIVCSTDNGFEAGKEYTAYVEATVDGVTGRDGIASFMIAGVNPDDLATAAAVAAVNDKTTNLPADPASATATTAIYDRIGEPAGASIAADVATRAPSATALSTAQWTNTRAGYLDKLNFEGAIGSASEVAAAVAAYVIDNTGSVPATLAGAIRRIDTMLTGRATGLRSGLVRFFARDGITELFQIARNVINGTRAAIDITDSEE